MTSVQRVSATQAALDLIDVLQAEHGRLMFHQSSGCCDGSAPMCFPEGEFLLGSADVKLGDVGGAPFYMSESQFRYWEHTHLTLDAIQGTGGQFSLERPTGRRFIIRSRLYTDEEWAELAKRPVERCG